MGFVDASARLRAALSAREESGEDALLRALVAHPDWLVPTESLAGLLLDTRTVRMISFGEETVMPPGELWVYGDRAAGEEAVQNEAQLGTYAADIWGVDLFGRLEPGVDTLCINPLGPAELVLTLGPEQLSPMRALAAAVALESIFPGISGGLKPSQARALRGFEGYLVIVDERRGPLTIEAPSAALPRALVAFTAEDCAKAFAEHLSTDTAMHVGVRRVDGPTLFGELVDETHDGVVINPRGPGERLALSAARVAALT